MTPGFVAVIAFVALFGASQIPKLARNLGEAGREFRKAHAELQPSGVPVPSPVPAGPVPTTAVPTTAVPTTAVPTGASPEGDQVTLTRDQFDRLLAARGSSDPTGR